MKITRDQLLLPDSQSLIRVRNRMNVGRRSGSQGFSAAVVDDSATSVTQAFTSSEALEGSPPQEAYIPGGGFEEKMVEELNGDKPQSTTIPPVKPPRNGGTLSRGDCTVLLSSLTLEVPEKTENTKEDGMKLVSHVHFNPQEDMDLVRRDFVENDEIGIRETGQVEDRTLSDVSSISEDSMESDGTQKEELITVGTTGAVMINESIYTNEDIY